MDGIIVCGLERVCVCAAEARNKAALKPETARRLSRASVGMSVAGIVVGVVIIITIVVLVTNRTSSCPYSLYGMCYKQRKYVGPYGACYGASAGDYCYYY